MSKSINTVVQNELCFGCGTCKVVCPAQAITIAFSSIGHLAPIVDEHCCTNCGLCMKVCPGIDKSGFLADYIDSSLLGKYKEVLCANSSNKEIDNNSQSGGAVTETLSYLFDEGRIDAALVVTQEKQQAKYILVTSKKDLAKCQSSQYTPVDLVCGLPLIKDYKHVAVVGLPCHIEGIVKLHEQFPKRYDNIEVLLGLICAGTQSQLLVDVVKRVGKKKIGDITENDTISWRQKKYSSYHRADIAVVRSSGEVNMLDAEVRHEAKKYFTSPRCRLCYDKMNLCADIVFGDAWGVNGIEAKQGGNVIICRTDKGFSIIDDMFVKGRLVGRKCSINEVEKGQGIPKKKKTVEKMLVLYEQLTYQKPGWANSAVFEREAKFSDGLRKDVEDYIKRSKCKPDKVVRKVSNAINRKLLLKRIKGFFKH